MKKIIYFYVYSKVKEENNAKLFCILKPVCVPSRSIACFEKVLGRKFTRRNSRGRVRLVVQHCVVSRGDSL